MADSSALVARMLTRSWRQRRGRVIASMATTVVGVVMATMITAVVMSITTAIDDSTGFSAVDSDVIVSSRSPAGLAPDVVDGITRSADIATAPVTIVNTRLSGVDLGQLTILGFDVGDLERFVSVDAGAEALSASSASLPLVVGAEWASEHGVVVGDTVDLSAVGGATPGTVAAVSDASLPNGGSIAFAPRASLQQSFDRNGVDLVFVQADDVEAATARLRDVTGGAAIVGSADDVLAPEQSSFAFVRQILVMTGTVGFLVAGLILLVSWKLLVEDQRDNVAKLRLIGAGRTALSSGSLRVLLLANLVAAAAAVPLGLLAATGMTSFARQVVNLTGLAASPTSPPLLVPAVVGVVASLVMAFLAWVSAVRALRRIPPIEAVRGVPAVTPKPTVSARTLAVGVAAALVAVVLVNVVPPTMAGLPVVFMLVAAIALSRVLPQVVGRVLGAGGTFSRIAAAREFAVGARKRAVLVAVLSTALMLTIGLAGVASTLGGGLQSSVEAWTGGDLYVMPAEPGRNLRDEKFPTETTARLEALDDVADVTPFTLSPLQYEERNVQLYAWGTEGVEAAVDLEVDEGASGAELWAALDAGDLAVSSNFAWLHDIEVGDELAVPSTDGEYTGTVASIVDDYTGDTGIVISSFETYATITGDDRTFDLIVTLADGVPVDQAKASIANELQDYEGLTVWTGDEMESHLMGLLGQVLAILRMIALFVLVLAVLVGISTTAASIAGRRRVIGVSRLIGAERRQISRQLTGESLFTGAVAWLIAAPLGLLVAVPGMVAAVGSQSGTFPPVQMPWPTIMLALAGALIAAYVAVRIPSRRLLDVDVAEVITRD